MKKVLTPGPMITFHSTRKFGNYLAREKLHPSEWLTNWKRCVVYMKVNETSIFISSVTNATCKMNHQFNCNGKCLIRGTNSSIILFSIYLAFGSLLYWTILRGFLFLGNWYIIIVILLLLSLLFLLLQYYYYFVLLMFWFFWRFRFIEELISKATSLWKLVYWFIIQIKLTNFY